MESLTIIWENHKGYMLGVNSIQEFVIKVDKQTEIEEANENNLMKREVSILQYVLYLKNGNDCVKLCAKNKLYDAKLIAKQFLERIHECRKDGVL